MPETDNHQSELLGARDTLESIWVAIVLALVLRAFVIEAFVIPTGSMAPHLMGQHMLLTCPGCGYSFPFGVSYDGATGRTSGLPAALRCPMCDTLITGRDWPILSGDRVLVLKYLYQFRPPARHDVVVFRNPQSNLENYIKRLVGLPGEVLRIVHGDVFVHAIEDVNGDGNLDELDLDRNGDGVFNRHDYEQLDWAVTRKDHRVQQGIWQLLHDVDYRDADAGRDWPRYWQGEPGQAAWSTRRGGRVFAFDGGDGQGIQFARGMSRAFLAHNFYNASPESSILNTRTDISSDLKLQTTITAESAEATVRLELSNFLHEFAAEFDMTGSVRLLHRPLDPVTREPTGAWAEMLGPAPAPALQAGRAVEIAIAHADWRVAVWVDGRCVLETDDGNYRPDVQELIAFEDAAYSGQQSIPTPRVGVTGFGGAFELWHTRVYRDVYYTSRALNLEETSVMADTYAMARIDQWCRDHEMSPRDWPVMGESSIPCWGSQTNPIVLRKFGSEPSDRDEFFMLGDNSPQSKDSRLWVTAAPTLRLYDDQGDPQYRLGTVPRYNLIGKAFFVYWPGGRNLLGMEKLPLVPDVGNMRVIE